MWTRMMIIVTVIVVVCGLYLAFFGPQTMWILESRYLGWKVPIVYKTPVELPESSISKAPGKKLSYNEYEFEVPWDDLDESRTKVYPNSVVLSFHSGLKLRFYNGHPKEFVDTILSSGKVEAQTLRQLYGNEALESDYALTRLMLDSTPSKITLWTSRKDAVGGAMMLAIKAIAMPTADTGLFSIHTKDLKGFQYGNPKGKPRRIVVDLFADDRGVELAFFSKDNALNISQADINRVVQTIEKAQSSLAR